MIQSYLLSFFRFIFSVFVIRFLKTCFLITKIGTLFTLLLVDSLDFHTVGHIFSNRTPRQTGRLLKHVGNIVFLRIGSFTVNEDFAFRPRRPCPCSSCWFWPGAGAGPFSSIRAWTCSSGPGERCRLISASSSWAWMTPL